MILEAGQPLILDFGKVPEPATDRTSAFMLRISSAHLSVGQCVSDYVQ